MGFAAGKAVFTAVITGLAGTVAAPLSGRLRLMLGEHDLTLTAGEAAEFDTHVPRWLGNPGPGPAEVLNLFDPQGERLHVRARPSRTR